MYKQHGLSTLPSLSSRLICKREMKLVFSEVMIFMVSLLLIGWNAHLIFEDRQSFLQDASCKNASGEAIVMMCLMSFCVFTFFHFYPDLFFMPGPARLTRDGIKFQRDIFDYLHSTVYFGFLACLAHRTYVLLVSDLQSSPYKNAYHVALLVAFSASWSFTAYLILPIRYPFQTHKLVRTSSDNLNQPDLQPSENFVISLGPPHVLPCKCDTSDLSYCG